MDARCEICGCATDAEQLKTYKIADREYSVCNFCRGRINGIIKNPSASVSEAENLLKMDTNGKRSAEAQQSLEALFKSAGVSKEPAAAAAPAQNAEVEQLKEQLETLSADFQAFKKQYFLSKILSVAIPVGLIIIMLLVMIFSGAFKSLFNYYDTIMEYANI